MPQKLISNAAYVLLLAVCSARFLHSADTAATKVQKSIFHVKYVAHNSVYIDGGTVDELVEGMTVELRHRPPGSAE